MSELKDFLPSGGSNKPQIDENTRRTLLINNPNLFINGCLSLNQRGSSSYETYGYTVDRWKLGTSNTTIKYATAVVTDNGVNAGIITNLKKPNNSDWAQLVQQVEDARKVSGKLVTISFYASTITGVGVIGLAPELVGGVKSYPIKGTTVEVNPTRTKYEVTFPIPTIKESGISDMADAGKTSIKFAWWFTAGSDFTERLGKVVSNEGMFFFIDSIKLELGDQATAFIPDTYQDNLLKCQRYFHKLVVGRYSPIPMTRRGGSPVSGDFTSGYRTPVQMREPISVVMIPSIINLQLWNIGEENPQYESGYPAKNITVKKELNSGSSFNTIVFKAPSQPHLGNGVVGAFANVESSTTFLFDAEL